MRLIRVQEPFAGQVWIFELKHDRFRGMAYTENGTCRLISRHGHEFKGFKDLCDGIAQSDKADRLPDSCMERPSASPGCPPGHDRRRR